MNNKDHLTLEGLNKIVNIKALMNLGLSEFLISEFKNKDFNLTNFSLQDKLPLPERKTINTENIPDLAWLVGFSSGEAKFDIKISQNSENTTGYRLTLRFRISQHERDKALLETIAKYLGRSRAGKVSKYPKQPAVVFTFFKFSEITEILIPLFEKNPLLGVKFHDFLEFCEAAKLIKDGKHLTLDGINQIIKLKSGMNRK